MKTNAFKTAAVGVIIAILATVTYFAVAHYQAQKFGFVYNPTTVSVNSVPSLASSSITFLIGNATTTVPAFLSAITSNQKTITKVDCWDAAAATTTVELYYNTTLASSGIQQVILASLVCGNAGNSTASFTTSTLPANAYLFAIVTATAGTPTLTTINVTATKN